MVDAVAEKRFLLLKKRLDALHYCQPFTIESAALIEKLLNDLIKTTEGFQSIKKTNEELKSSLEKSETRLEPLKKEIAKLTKDNNDLHFELIRVKEQAEYKEATWQNRFKSLEGDKDDLKRMLQMKDSKFNTLEEESFALRRKLDLVMKKYTGKGAENIPPDVNGVPVGRSGRFEMTKPLKSGDFEDEIENAKKNQPDEFKKWADDLRRADEKVNSLKEELKDAAGSRSTLEEKLRHLEKQVGNRDQEIKRLQMRLDVEGGAEKISTDYTIKSSGDKIEKLNSQIDFLTKENFRLEDTVKDQKKELGRSEHLRTQNSQLEASLRELTQKNEDLRGTLKNNERVIGKMRETKNLAETEFVAAKDDEVRGLKEDIDRLNDRIENLIIENTQLKMNQDRAGQSLSAYNSDKLAFSETIQNIQKDQAAAEAKAEKLQFDLEKQTLENEHLTDNLNVAQGRVQSLQREIDLLKLNKYNDIEDYRSSEEATNNLRSRIAELEAENRALSSGRMEQDLQLERANRLKTHLEQQLEDLKNASYQSKANVDSSNVAKQRSQVLYEEAQKDIEFLKGDRKSLEAKLLDEKRANQELDLKCNDYFNNLKESQDRIKDLEREINMLNDQLAIKSQEVRRVEGLRLEIERDYTALKGSNHKLDDQIDRNKRLREDMRRLEDERVAALKKVDELTFEVKELNDRVVRQEDLIKRERDAKEELNEKIDMLATQSENFDMNLKRVGEREREHNRLLSELEESKKRERELVEDNERMKREMRKQETLIAQGSKQVEHINHQKDELMNEIKGYLEEISILKTSDSEVKMRSIKLQEKVNNYEIQLADLKDEREKDEKKMMAMEEDIRRGGIELERERQKNADLNQQIHQLKTLAESLENTKEEMLARLQNKNNERNLEEGERMRLQDEIKRLQGNVSELEGENRETREALQEMDREKDSIQEHLDQKTEDLEILKRKLEDQEEELRRLRERSSEFMATSDVNVSRIHEQESQLREIHRKSQILNEENNHLKHVLQEKEDEVRSLSNDLNIITRENQNLSHKLGLLVEEKERAKDMLGNVGNQEKMLRQSLRATEMDREDILNNYRAVCVENDRLKRNCEELTADNQEFFKQIKEMEREINYLRTELHQFEAKEGQFMNELSAYERNVNMLTRKVEQSERMLQDALEAKERTIREFNQIRQANEGFEHSQGDLQKSLVRHDQERMMMQGDLRELQNEVQMHQQQVEFERRRAQQLEGLLTEERRIQQRQHIEIENLENEKIELQMTLGNYQKKLHSTQGNISRGDMDSFHIGDTSGVERSRVHHTMRSVDQRLGERDSEVKNLIHEQRELRDENSRLKADMLQASAERGDFDNRLRYNDSLESAERSISDRQLFDGTSSKGESDVWDKLKYESETFKKNLEEASLSSKYLKEKVKSLQNDYKEFLPGARKNY